MKKRSLNGTWQACGISPEGQKLYFKGEVPGCVHTDLLREGQIRDPFYQKQSQECQWIERWDWYYERSFVVEKLAEGMYFRFDGLDTICEIYLNGKRIGSADNMFLIHTFPAKGLKVGENTLRVVFTSPVTYMAGRPTLSGAFTRERMYTRRMQCTYFWDWVERFVTFGIYRDCALITPETAEIASVYLYTKSIDRYSAQLGLQLRTILHGEGAYAHYRIADPSGATVYEKTRWVEEPFACEKIDIPSPHLWYPNGYGEQPLYEVKVGLYEDIECRLPLEERTELFGIRTVKILELPDKKGSEEERLCLALQQSEHLDQESGYMDRNESFSGFRVLVNGLPIDCRGANWVPCDPFPSSEEDGRITALLSLAKEGGMNMVRVWGGGLFEKDHFYRECDRLGLLVTQDFMMACGDYPEDDDAFCEQIRREAEQAVIRLRNHPCLAWWTGDNENGTYADENKKGYASRRVSMAVLAPTVVAYDPYRDFLLSSPYGGVPFGSITKGSSHNTNFVGQMFAYFTENDLADYRTYFERFLCRFCAEHPAMGAPTLDGTRRFLGEEGLREPSGDLLRFHTKNNPGFTEYEVFDFLNFLAEKVLGSYRDPVDRHLKQQYIQYEWIRITSELFRRHAPFASGLLYWMLNDCWPAAGWALIDYYTLPKQGYYAAKRTNRPVIVSLTEKDGQYEVHLCNASLCKGEVSLCLRALRLPAGEELGRRELTVSLPEGRAACVMTLPKDTFGEVPPEELLLVCDLTGEGLSDRAHFFALRPKEMAFPTPQVEITASDEQGITVTSQTVTLAVMLDGNVAYGDNGFLLLPNESRRVAYRRVFPNEPTRIELHALGEPVTES